jgi:hypothetical protein
MDLEIIRLSEISQTQKDKYHVVSFLGRLYKLSHRIRKENGGYQRLGRRREMADWGETG